MKSILLSVCGVLLFSSASSFSDSAQTLTNLNASFYIQPNTGTSENLFGTISGSGVNLSVAGTSPAGWFTSGVGIAPGSYVGGNIPIHVDSLSGFLQGSRPNLSMESADFNAGAFALPTNGQNEFQTVPATLNLMFTSCLQNVCTAYDLNTAGRLGLYYLFNPSNGLYYPFLGGFATSASTAVPEPSTLGFVGFGLTALLGAVAWKNRYKTVVS